MTPPLKLPRKLIEVALPLDAINAACKKEASPFTPRHPRSLHIWWARRRLAAARAVIFAQMVNDPGRDLKLQHNISKEKAQAERERLFKIMEKLVLWENTNNEEVLAEAREEIWKSWRTTCNLNKNHPHAAELFDPEKLPAFHDPFAGGGALPLEAQRLGLEAYASDLNPVAVLINKAMIELPSRFANRPPIAPPTKGTTQASITDEEWIGGRGLFVDVQRYGAWMRDKAYKRIGHLYPSITITPSMAEERPDLSPLLGQTLPVAAWLWARTVRSPNPAFASIEVPLATTFVLSSKPGKEAYIDPLVESGGYRFVVRVGEADDVERIARGTKSSGSGSSFACIMSGTAMPFEYLREEAKEGRMSTRLMAIVAESKRGRVFLTPTSEMEAIAKSEKPTGSPESELPKKALGFRVQEYGITKWRELFTDRQLIVLNTLGGLVEEVVQQALSDALAAGLDDDGLNLEEGGNGAKAYADAIGVYLGLSVSRWADLSNSFVTWNNTNQNLRALFSRQAIPMTWDFAEVNAFGPIAPWDSTLDTYLALCPNLPSKPLGYASQADASTQGISTGKVISTDPPYYNNIGYADLSDFFYVWLRKSLRPIYPKLFGTLGTPKAGELIATPYRHGGKGQAERFFMDGMTHAIHNLVERAHPAFPVTIYYAFKQSDTKEDKTVNSGWETFLQAVIVAGFGISGTWPLRTEREGRSVSIGTNSLASCILLVCRRRALDAPSVSRRDFLRELNATLPEALAEMTRSGINSPVAPVDLSQAIIGPGMAIFSQYSSVLEADGKPMSVHTALTLINRFLAEDDLDPESQFCLHWFEEHGWAEGVYGDADVLCRSKGTSVDALKQDGVVEGGGGRVRLFRWTEYPDGWQPERDPRIPSWEALHQLIRALDYHGEEAAGALLNSLATRAEGMRTLAYRLYTLCERQGWAEDARAYNTIITAWPAIENMSTKAPKAKDAQINLDL